MGAKWLQHAMGCFWTRPSFLLRHVEQTVLLCKAKSIWYSNQTKGLRSRIRRLTNYQPQNLYKQPRKFSWQLSSRDKPFCLILQLAIIATCLCICLLLITDTQTSKKSICFSLLIHFYHIYILQYFFWWSDLHCISLKNTHHLNPKLPRSTRQCYPTAHQISLSLSIWK